MKLLRAAVLAFCLAFVLPACARECAPRLQDGWIRLTPLPLSKMPMPMMAGFGRIDNPCPAPVTITGVSSPSFGDVSLHETRVVDGVSRMRALPQLRIAPGEAGVLKPGGMHLMLMQPRVPLKEGSRVVVEFALADGGVLRGELEVRKPAP